MKISDFDKYNSTSLSKVFYSLFVCKLLLFAHFLLHIAKQTTLFHYLAELYITCIVVGVVTVHLYTLQYIYVYASQLLIHKENGRKNPASLSKDARLTKSGISYDMRQS